MNHKAKATTVATLAAPLKEPREGYYLTPPNTLDERVHRIEALGQRIDGYVRFMCEIAALNGTSAEAKDRGVTTFYERLVIVESQLRRIHDELRLE